MTVCPYDYRYIVSFSPDQKKQFESLVASFGKQAKEVAKEYEAELKFIASMDQDSGKTIKRWVDWCMGLFGSKKWGEAPLGASEQ